VSEKTIVHQPGEGMAFWLLGGLYEVLVSSDQSHGAVTIMQLTMPAGFGPPPHTHDGAETVFIVEGTVTYHVGGEMIDAGPGALFHIPAGTLEWFEPTSTVKVLATYSPGGIEQFFAEVGEPALRREIPPTPTTPPDVESLVAAGARFGLHIEPPPG